MSCYIETERLKIAEFEPCMAESVHRLSLDDDNRRFMPDEVFETYADAVEAIEELMALYAGTDGPFVYPILLKDGTHIGHVEAVRIPDGWEVGYHIGREYTGKGFATEALRAFAPVIMERLELERLWGICDAENLASRRVLEKSRFRLLYDGLGLYHKKQIRLRRYALSKEDLI